MYRVVDKVVSNGRGDGLDENGEQVFLDSTQALPRRPYCSGVLPTILPNCKIINMATQEIVHPQRLAQLQGILPTYDISINYSSLSVRVLADMAGNAMAGWSFSMSSTCVFGTSGTPPSVRLNLRLSIKFGRIIRRSAFVAEYGSMDFSDVEAVSPRPPPVKKGRYLSPLEELLSLDPS